MRWNGWLRGAVILTWLTGSGCSTLREIPPSHYAEHEKRRDVRVEMTDGRVFEFDEIHVDGDTLTGYKREDTEGRVDDFATVRFATGDVSKMSARSVDWNHTGLLTALIVGVVVAVGLTVSANTNTNPSEAGGGGKPLLP